MITENVRALVSYRLEQADESLDAARLLAQEGLHRSAANRAYYAMFYSVLALLATRKLETSRHSGAISLFDREFVKPGRFARDLSRWLHEAFGLRQRSDYASGSVVTREDVETTLRHALSFVGEVKALVAKLFNEPDCGSDS